MPEIKVKTTERGTFRCAISVNSSFVSGVVILAVTSGSRLVLPGGQGVGWRDGRTGGAFPPAPGPPVLIQSSW